MGIPCSLAIPKKHPNLLDNLGYLHKLTNRSSKRTPPLEEKHQVLFLSSVALAKEDGWDEK
jgi:hypothetical protein